MTTINSVPGAAAMAATTDNLYTEAARTAARTADFQRISHEVLTGIESVGYESVDGVRNDGRPRLQPPPPRVNGDQSSAEGEFVRLIASLIELLGNANLESLKNRLSMLRAVTQSSQQGLDRLSADYKQALGELVAAQGAVDTSQEQLQLLKDRLDQAQIELEAAESHLASLDPSSPEYADALARRDAAKAALGGLQQGFEAALKAHLGLLATAKSVAIRTEALARQVQAAGIDGKVVDQLGQEHLNAAGALALAMAQLIALLGEAADKQMQADQELFLSMQTARQEFMKVKSEEYQEEVRKAEAAQKVMGCIGKIFGWLVMAVSAVVAVVGTVATLGAAAPAAGALVSAAVGIVGVLASLTDMIVKEATGTSYMEKAMKPLMEEFQKLVKLLGDLTTKFLTEVLKVSEDIAKIIGSVSGAIAAVAVVIAAAVVGVHTAGPILGSVLNKVMEKLGEVFAKILPSLLKQMVGAIGKTLAKLVEQLRGLVGSKSDDIAMAQLKNRLEILLAGVSVAGVGTQSGLQIQSGVHQKKGAEHLADVRVSMAIVDSLGDYLKESLETFVKAIEQKDNQLKQLMADMQHRHGASLHIARHI
ncbi:pathogenicity island 1 effector protein SipB [Pseudomonas agarici]|uniref:Pathogenicity island 1 effector protein SipB n=1 Tax=Pseudomonas agarici TaxID=46677 RepID=A0A0X1T887_PSEAA|nr:type III secretion system translocon subunit SctE [Pseudomonas agarici]AMB87999.1 pathogenicity island 1 effector protein SipB [Pseudomonas agarici]NWC09146.1 type III secretion system translocon subunit SctE [Pseudomonas agarici]SEK33302.1 type III secretion system translocon protein, YopB/IpaB/SipB family [Pseudomonas agarici]